MTQQKTSPYKILVYPMPLSGHMNPLLPILKELIDKHKHVRVLVFTTEAYKKSIEATGAEFCPVDLTNAIHFANNIKPLNNKRTFQLFNIIASVLNMPGMQENVASIAEDIKREDPDIVLYDILNPLMGWAVRYYNKWLGISKKTSPADRSKLKFCPSRPMPTLMSYSTTFAINDPVYPNSVENAQVCTVTLGMFWDMFRLLLTYVMFSFKLGVEFVNPFKDISTPITNTKLVMATVSPDLQPRSHLFDANVWKFIGSTLDERVTNMSSNSLVNEQVFKDILGRFEVREEKKVNFNRLIKNII